MIFTKEPQNSKQYLHLNESHHIMVPNGEEDLFMAYLEFAYYHIATDIELYENAESLSIVPDFKKIFSQMSCRKRETVQILKMNRSEKSIPYTSSRNSGKGSLTRYSMDSLTTMAVTLEDAFNFIRKREYTTLLLYEKVLKSTTLSSIRTLFEFMIRLQREHIAYISSEFPEVCGSYEFVDMVA